MRLLSFCILCAVAAGWLQSSLAEGPQGEKPGELEKLLTAYLEERLAQAQSALKSVQDSQNATMLQILAAEDEVDRWAFQLRLVTEGKLVAEHPVLNELRRELGVPDLQALPKAAKAEAVSSAIQEYIKKRLDRTQRAYETARALFETGRATEPELLAAKSRVAQVRLLLEVEVPGVGSRTK